MRELVEYLAKSLTSNPDAVVVTEEIVDGRVTIRLEVAPEDKGKVIGRQGRVAQAMRLLVRASATKNGSHAMLEIV
ncbi:MAG: RNA-binding protein [Dehalococcoidia bacterium]|nr:RNA-binding protein [Dehalococcoidia bacterium]|tara:strand:+ start:12439 stop:12666 length:228 start_codon:yes stop_codon:yes gene_type:complete